MVAVQKLSDDLKTGKINRKEYNQKWNDLKSQDGPWSNLREKVEKKKKLDELAKAESDPLKCCVEEIFKEYSPSIPAKQTEAIKIKENVKSAYDIVQNLEQNVNALRSSESSKRNKLSPQQLLNKLEAKAWTTIECQIKKFLSKLSPEEVKKQLNLAKEVTDAKKEQPKLINFLELLESRKKELKKDIDEMSKNCRIPEQKTKVEEMRNIELKRLDNTINNLKKQTHNFVSKQLPKPDKLGNKLNVHALDSDHVGQFAADLPSDEGSDGRGQKRVVYDAIETESGTYNFVLVGITLDHDYTQVPKYREVADAQIEKKNK